MVAAPPAENPGMRHVPRPFLETLFDWEAQPANKRTTTLFQPKGLGTVLPGSARRGSARRMLSFGIGLISLAAGMVAVAVFARLFHLGFGLVI